MPLLLLCALLPLRSVGQSYQAAAGLRPGMKPHAKPKLGGRRNRLPHLTFITFGGPPSPCGTPLKITAPSGRGSVTLLSRDQAERVVRV
jgi:hypothetical protein